jgi:TolB-like protein
LLIGVPLAFVLRKSPTVTAVRSIAVLPLENLSGDATEEYFADGMTDELITNLAKIESLRIISRTSVMQYKRAHQPLPEIARVLKVDLILTGGVLRSGDRVRITTQLVDGKTDSHLWAREFERLEASHSANPQAHDLYLRGRYQWS